jgi:hypothetical protein
MRSVRRMLTRAGFLSLALLPLAAAVSPAVAPSTVDGGSMPVAIAHPLATIERGPIAAISAHSVSRQMQPESGLLVLVGSGLFGLASLVRRTTK